MQGANSSHTVHDSFDLTGKTVVITGGAGLLGFKHAEALMEYGANCALVDICEDRAVALARSLTEKFSGQAQSFFVDITNKQAVMDLLDRICSLFGDADILINNAANNPKFEDIEGGIDFSKRFETFPLEVWENDIAVGLTGSFVCSQVFGSYFATKEKGVILNIASDLALIAPDQRIYEQEGLSDDEQPTKPATYSVVKAGLIGLTKYLATYWGHKGVRCNALVPGGVYTGQDETFVSKLTNLIPMGRMATADEYKAAVVFLCSDASAYMNGSSLVIEGGRTCW